MGGGGPSLGFCLLSWEDTPLAQPSVVSIAQSGRREMLLRVVSQPHGALSEHHLAEPLPVPVTAGSPVPGTGPTFPSPSDRWENEARRLPQPIPSEAQPRIQRFSKPGL